jgi:ELWxxDGT repeat protein
MKHQKAILGLLAGAVLVVPWLHPAAAEPGPGPVPELLDPEAFTVLGDRLYFSASSDATGREPWVTDGTAAGTRLVSDVCPGPCSSYAVGFGEIGGRLVVVAQIENETLVLKEKDGKLERVVTLAGHTNSFFQLGNQVYFPLRQGKKGELILLIASDGTAAGTVVASPLCFGSECGGSFSFARAGDAVYFVVADAYLGTEVKRLVAGQAAKRVIKFDVGTEVDSLRALDGQRVVFRMISHRNRFGIVWIYDSGAHARRVEPRSPFSRAESFLATWRGRVYYRNTEGNMVTTSEKGGDLRPATELTGARPGVWPIDYAEHLYYMDGGNLRVHRADGVDLALLSGSGTYTIQGVWGDKALIRQNDRLFATDGTGAGTVELPDVLRNGVGVPFRGDFFFAGSTSGPHKLWRTDGSPAGTYEIAAE